ncbi:hypothetical protein [Runella limosa]|uniref:hypothetical protein n=1 Tax=Runella limosa TaxID=370978 RepID=UPI0004095416|nr:hypothetical protein [Runella limosa]
MSVTVAFPSAIVGTIVGVTTTGWTINSNTGGTIVLTNSTSILAGACSQITLGYTATTLGGPSAVTGTLSFPAGALVGDLSTNNTSTTSISVLLDTDGDLVPDVDDLDDDNDGILDTVEAAASCTSASGTVTANIDCDGDGIPNRLDLDSDNDGINDVNEANGTDANFDGFADGTPDPVTGIPASAGAGLTPPNTDGTGGTNPYDLDSDNDGLTDFTESGTNPALDANGDGVVDGTAPAADPDADGIFTPVDAVPATRGDNLFPDLNPTIVIGSLEFTTAGSQKDFVVNLFEINNRIQITGTPISFRVAKISGFNITYSTTSGTSNAGSSIANSNSDWDFVENANFITVTAKTGITIAANGSKVIGFTATRKTGIPINTTQNITATIINGSAGEIKVDNNIAITSITAN